MTPLGVEMTKEGRDRGRVLVLDARSEARGALETRLAEEGYELVDRAAKAIDVIIAHPSIDGWPRSVERLLRDDDDRRLVVVIDELEQGLEAVNELGVDRLATDLDSVVVAVRQLRGPLMRRPTLETRVRERTATLQQIKAQWEQTFDAVAEPLAVIDDTYRLVRINRAYAAALDREIVELPGRICHEARKGCPASFATRDEDGRCSGCPVAATMADGQSRSETLIDSVGRHWLVSAHPVQVEGMPPSIVVQYRDVTRQVREQAQLSHESKAAALGNLAGAVAHELNSPMTSIMVFSESLARKTAEGSELNDNALEINEAARRCRRLIQGLLRFARRPRSGAPTPLSLGQVFDETRPLLEHRLDIAQVELRDELPFDLPRVRGQLADLEHVLVDLLVNALEACEAGDSITVSAEVVGDQVELVVRDTGRGMSEELLAQAFEPFFTTKSDGRGTGLGLTTSEALITQMGGEITLTSTVGDGTRAAVRLPIAEAEQEGR